jgi:hypothetical protein
LAHKKTVRSVAKQPDPGEPDAAVFSPTGDKLVVAYVGAGLWLLPLDGSKALPLEYDRRTERPRYLPSLTFTPDGKYVVGSLVWSERNDQGQEVWGRGIQLWDAATGKKVRRFGWEAGGLNPRGWVPAGISKTFCLSADGKRLLAEHRQKLRWEAFSQEDTLVTYRLTVRLWDLASGRELGVVGRAVEVTYREVRNKGAIAASYPDGARLRELGALGHGCRVRISPTGRILVYPRDLPAAVLEVARDATKQDAVQLSLRDLVTGKELYRIALIEKGYPHHFELSPDNRSLAVSVRVASSGEERLLLLDLSRWREEALRTRKTLTGAELAHCWEELGAEDPLRALQAARRLAASPEQALPFLEQRVHPAPEADPKKQKQLATLITQLDDQRYEVRQQAERDLIKLGAEAMPAVRQALAGKPSAELRRRLEQLPARLSEELGPDAATRRHLWGIELLERWGTPAAERLLERLAQGAPDVWVTHEARTSLELLRKRDQ